MTIRVDITNKDDVILYVEEDEGGLKQLQPGQSGTFYVKKTNRIRLREDMRARDRFTQGPARDRRQKTRRFEDEHNAPDASPKS